MYKNYKKELKLIRKKDTQVINDYELYNLQKKNIDEYEFIDNYSFVETLYFDRFDGYNSVNAKLKDAQGKEYHMFMKDFQEVFKLGFFNGVEIKGPWSFRKQGRAYGLIKLDVD